MNPHPALRRHIYAMERKQLATSSLPSPMLARDSQPCGHSHLWLIPVEKLGTDSPKNCKVVFNMFMYMY